MKNFLSIKEFSAFSGIETTTLRYWDDIGLFSPAKRDPINNYRYYTPDQIIGVNFISVLSSLEVPLKTISEMKNKRTPENIMDLIEDHEKLLDIQMRRLRECYSIIHTRRDLIKIGMNRNESEISVMHKDERGIILGSPCDFREDEEFYGPFMRFCKEAESLRINLSYPIGGYHESMETFLKAPGKPDRFFSTDPAGNTKRVAGEYMVAFIRGYYGELDVIAPKMLDFANENSLTFSGPVYAIYLHDEVCLKDPDQYLAQVCVAVKKKKS